MVRPTLFQPCDLQLMTCSIVREIRETLYVKYFLGKLLAFACGFEWQTLFADSLNWGEYKTANWC